MSTIKPILTWKTTFQPGIINKLSYVAPYNQCTITFSCNKYYKKFVCRTTYEDEEWGPDNGILVQEYNNREADSELSFILDSTRHLIYNNMQKNGNYRVGLYVQDIDDKWNLEAYFYINTGSAFYVQDNDNEVHFVAEYVH